MSCESKSNKVVALARKVGIPHLSGKKAFYAGLLVAASQASVVLATLGLLAAIRAKARGNESPGQEAPGGNDRKPVAIVTPQDIPALPSRTAITPAAPQALSGKTCNNCSASPRSKPGMWYIIDGKAYCQDCAPRAASEADIDLATPPRPSPASAPQIGTPVEGPKTRRDTMQEILASANPGRVRLREAPVDVKTADGWVSIPNGAYFVYTPGGTGTGLAITPLLKRDGQGGLTTDPVSLNVTHLKSGMTMAGPYSSVEEARRLVSVLAQIDWRREVDVISRRELAATQQVVKAYNEALAEARARSGDRAMAGNRIQPADLFRHSK